jgi:translation initiation factor 1
VARHISSGQEKRQRKGYNPETFEKMNLPPRRVFPFRGAGKFQGLGSMEKSRLVYSTETGRICPDCGKPTSRCSCKKKKLNDQSGYPNDGIVRIRREVKGRKGKTVTAIFGVPLDDNDLNKFAKKLKRRCGAGGSVKDGVIIIQGDHRRTLLDEIKKQGYSVKIAGG